MFYFLYFYTSVYFKTLEMKILIDPDKMPKEVFFTNKQLEKFDLNFKLTQD